MLSAVSKSPGQSPTPEPRRRGRVPRSDWLSHFAAPGALEALRAAAEVAMQDGCSLDAEEPHEPEVCGCETNLVTPLEFASWIELRLRTAIGGPRLVVSPDARTAGQLRRWNAPTD